MGARDDKGGTAGWEAMMSLVKLQDLTGRVALVTGAGAWVYRWPRSLANSARGSRSRREWRLEVSDETGEPLHLFRLTAQTFKKG